LAGHSRRTAERLPSRELWVQGFLHEQLGRSVFFDDAPEVAMAVPVWPYLERQRFGAEAVPPGATEDVDCNVRRFGLKALQGRSTLVWLPSDVRARLAFGPANAHLVRFARRNCCRRGVRGEAISVEFD
jgi:hypothetical protein